MGRTEVAIAIKDPLEGMTAERRQKQFWENESKTLRRETL